MDTQFVVASETYAEKTRRLLERYRYRFRMTKTTGASGCTYRFKVSGASESIFALLAAHGIPYETI